MNRRILTAVAALSLVATGASAQLINPDAKAANAKAAAAKAAVAKKAEERAVLNARLKSLKAALSKETGERAAKLEAQITLTEAKLAAANGFINDGTEPKAPAK